MSGQMRGEESVCTGEPASAGPTVLDDAGGGRGAGGGENLPGRIGVVTVTYNSAPVLQAFMLALRSQTGVSFRVYVIDNASGDSSAELAEALGAGLDLVVIRNRQNVGFAAATNQGIERALHEGCSHVLVLNNDTVFEPRLLVKLLAAARGHAIVVPKMYYEGRDRILWFAGGRVSPWRGFSLVHIGQGERDLGQYDAARQIEAATGCCMLVAAAVFRKIGMLDPSYFAYYEDLDFSVRAGRAGFDIWYAPEAHLHHKVSALTGGESSDFSARMGARNKVYYVRKNFGRLACVSATAAYFAYLLLRLVTRKDSAGRFHLRVRALLEGVRMSAAATGGRGERGRAAS